MLGVDKNKLHTLTITGLFLLFLLGIAQPAYSLGRILMFGRLIDFGVYYQAARTALMGISPYSTGENTIPFNYQPASLFLFIPFSLFPLFSAQIIWTIFSAGCLGLSIYLLLKSLNWKLKFEEFLLLIPLITLSFPVKWTFGMGQINHLILLLLVATFYFYKRKKDFLAGVFLGTAVVLKLVPAFLLGLFLIKRKLKIVSYSLGTIFLLTLLAGLVFRFELTKEYFFRIVPTIFSPSGKEVYYNQSITGFIARLTTDNNLRFYLYFLSSFFIFGVCWLLVSKRKDLTGMEYSLIIVLMLLVNGLSWQHHFVWILIPFLMILPTLNKASKVFRAFFLISYFLIAFNIKNPASFRGTPLSPFVLSHVFFGTLILFCLLFYSLTKNLILKK